MTTSYHIYVMERWRRCFGPELRRSFEGHLSGCIWQWGGRGRGGGWRVAKKIWSSWSSELDLAGGEGLILHDDGTAGGQNHDVEVLLPLVGLLVPLPGHLSVVGWYQSHLSMWDRSNNVRLEDRGQMDKGYFCKNMPNSANVLLFITYHKSYDFYKISATLQK